MSSITTNPSRRKLYSITNHVGSIYADINKQVTTAHGNVAEAEKNLRKTKSTPDNFTGPAEAPRSEHVTIAKEKLEHAKQHLKKAQEELKIAISTQGNVLKRAKTIEHTLNKKTFLISKKQHTDNKRHIQCMSTIAHNIQAFIDGELPLLNNKASLKKAILDACETNKKQIEEEISTINVSLQQIDPASIINPQMRANLDKATTDLNEEKTLLTQRLVTATEEFKSLSKMMNECLGTHFDSFYTIAAQISTPDNLKNKEQLKTEIVECFNEALNSKADVISYRKVMFWGACFTVAIGLTIASGFLFPGVLFGTAIVSLFLYTLSLCLLAQVNIIIKELSDSPSKTKLQRITTLVFIGMMIAGPGVFFFG